MNANNICAHFRSNGEDSSLDLFTGKYLTLYKRVTMIPSHKREASQVTTPSVIVVSDIYALNKLKKILDILYW